MRTLLTMLVIFMGGLFGYAQDKKTNLSIVRQGHHERSSGSPRNFSGRVTVESLFGIQKNTHASGAYVTFSSGARSNWHSHPAGQTLIVTAGVGRVQEWGGDVKEIRSGDVIWTPPGVKHWHGAAPGETMTHMAIQEAVDGKSVEWLERVSEENFKSIPVKD